MGNKQNLKGWSYIYARNERIWGNPHVGPLRLDFSAASEPFELKLSGKRIDMPRKL